MAQNIKVNNAVNEIEETKSFVFVDPKTGEHYQVYGNGGEGIFLLHINPQNGLPYEDGRGINLAKGPSFNNHISDATIFYNSENDYYYLLAAYGGENTANIRVGRSKTVYGPYVDANNYRLNDIDDLEGKRGTLIDTPHLFDGVPSVKGYRKPEVVGNKLMCLVRLDNEEKFVLAEEEIVFINDWPLIIPYGFVKKDDINPTIEQVAGSYEYIKYNKYFPLPLLDYVNMTLLKPNEAGVSSTKNEWALKVPHSCNGRVELGGSHRGYWLYATDGRLIVNYLGITDEFTIVPVTNKVTGEDTVVLIGMDNNGIVTVAKRY